MDAFGDGDRRSSGYRRGASGVIEAPEYLHTHIDPYGGDGDAAASPAPFPKQRTAIFAPSRLHGSPLVSNASSAPSPDAGDHDLSPSSVPRKVSVMDSATPMESAVKQRYERGAMPPKRPPLVQVYQPPLSTLGDGADSSDDGAVGRPQPPRSRGPGSAGLQQRKDRKELTSRDTTMSSFNDDHPAYPARRRGTLVGTPAGSPTASQLPARASSSAAEEGPLRGSLSSSSSASRSNRRSSAAAASQRRSTDAAATPVVDFFSATEAESPTLPLGPMAISSRAIRNTTYVAQTAYTQKNPFRVQTFADFSAHPIADPPEHFRTYPDAVTETGGAVIVGADRRTSTALAATRATTGEFLLRRLAERANPLSAEERDDMIALLNETLEVLQTGDWFYKWTRKNTVHRRFVWVNLQRGTLAWSPSPKRSLVWNSELKIAEIISIKPDCIRDGTTGRSFYRMRISSASRGLCLATEMREKFDCWFRALEQLTMPNLSTGVPSMWGRPTSVVNNGRRGALGRWASRYSPLQAVADGTEDGEAGGVKQLRSTGGVASSD